MEILFKKINKEDTNAADFRGGNPWGGISVDEQNKVVYLTTAGLYPYCKSGHET